MHPPPKAINEAQRQAGVDELLRLNPELESAFDRVTHLVATQLRVPISAFTIVDRERQYFACIQGLGVQETPRDISFCGHAILQDDIFIVPNANQHKDFHDNPLVTGEPNISFYAGAPVHTPNHQIIGTLCAIDRRPRKLTRRMRRTLLDLRDIMESLIKLLSLSLLDHLTGLYNRRHFDESIGGEWHKACRLRLPIALLSIDIDYFKSYNDLYGHQAGDSCLRTIAETVATECRRSGDIPFRTGGEEFAVLLTATGGGQQATYLAQRLLQAIRALAIPHLHSPSQIVTVSIGLASAESLPRDGSGFGEFIRCSDHALYAAKHQGRDRVVANSFDASLGCHAAELE